jgi:trehalose 6-phosphate synthase/phosphatase
VRLVIVSNRLPITFRDNLTTLQKHRSIGGLVTGIESYIAKLANQETDFDSYLWVGWPGNFISEEHQSSLSKTCQDEHYYVPVYLDKHTIAGHYFGFCNETIWPLFHYFPEHVHFEPDQWDYYRYANEAFYQTLQQHLQADDVVWVQDYHLMLLPQMLRTGFPKLAISFFLHIPFPAFDVLRYLPRVNRQQLLEGLLGADLIGFHTYGYTKNFLRSLYKDLNLLAVNNEVSWLGRKIKADVYPMGINYKAFRHISSTQACEVSRAKIRQRYTGQKLLLSIDRLDYTKGIINRLKAFEYFLRHHSIWRQKVVLLLVVAPSRREISSYDRLKQQIDECVGRINGEYGSHHWTPIIYQYRQVEMEELCALYGASDVALVTPLRDGMNLIAKEYIACLSEQKGVLIISELAGAADELAGALAVNPYHAEELAATIHTALEMSIPEQANRCQRLQQRLQQYDVQQWAREILEATLATRASNEHTTARRIDAAITTRVQRAFQQAQAGLLIINYEDILAAFASSAEPSKELLYTISGLAAKNNITLVIMSGQDKATLSEWFSGCDVLFSASLVTCVGKPGQEQMSKNFDCRWKQLLKPLLQKYALRLPSSHIEERECALVWDYCLADPELRILRVTQLLTELDEHNAYNSQLNTLCGENSLIIRNVDNSNEDDTIQYWLTQRYYDFILAVGAGEVAEELFAALPEQAYSLCVGTGRTKATYASPSQQQAIDLLNQLVSSTVLSPKE